MLKNLLLFIIILFLFIVFYFNKNEYFFSGTEEITIDSYKEQLNKLKTISTTINTNISALSANNNSSLDNVNSINNVNTVRTNLQLPSNITKDPTSQIIL
jgi:hypothetical protein